MPLMTATKLGKSYDPVDIFEDITLSIPHRARIAIVGANGVGKTTLLRILAGEDEPSSGAVHRARGLRLGYLPQEAIQIQEGTLWLSCLGAFEALLAKADELHAMERAMQLPDCDRQLLERYGRMQAEFESAGGYTLHNRIEQTLTGLGFEKADYERPLAQLSGGQRTRARLARLLLENPDLLLLDEPSNHLDIQAVEWLEAYLKDWDGAAVIVSHDRYFLDQVANHILEMTPSIEEYRGNYSAYLRQREERYLRRMQEFEAQNEYIAKQEDYIKKNIGTQNNAQAKGRLRRLERLLAESRLSAPSKHQRPMHLRFNLAGRSGNIILRSYDLAVGYEDEGKALFKAPDLVLERTECVAIIGPNGAGKTTFLKTILGILPPYSGSIELGAALRVGYFAQTHEGLTPNNNLVEEVNTVAPSMLPGEVRNYLGRYGFQGDDVFNPVSTLSGGERGRLALAKLALSDANLLILDEPTNHLDLPTQEVLQQVLAEYPGTILLVSHDRYLIDALATQIWEMNPEKEALDVFKGSYSEFKEAKEKRLSRQAVEQQASSYNTSAPVQEKEDGKKASPRLSLSRNQKQQLHKKLSMVEAKIHRAEAEKNRFEGLLSNPPADAAAVAQLAMDYEEAQHQVEVLMKEWENLAWTLEEAGWDEK
ncbi:MAG: ABC-F family ATP-binding cassette domain-containing protein [Anaerolineaceae bacterium]|nr:ABC-F family ATP-binding cassette domain-containing protein [Anaerolineaceae bacterium]